MILNPQRYALTPVQPQVCGDCTSSRPSIRRAGLWLAAALFAVLVPPISWAAQPGEDEISRRFDFLSKNGNSNCSSEFLESIPVMARHARLQGSCCGPMSPHRYREQIDGLKASAAISEVPSDPYDVEARLAKRLLAAYDVELPPEGQKAYDAAMSVSAEGGPCCCQCWRWHVFGGLGKLLINTHGFDGVRLAKVWDLSDGCGGDSHVH